MISDAYLLEEHIEVYEPELRDGIGIDRVTGGVAGGAKFDMEVLPAGATFTTQVVIQNFELWQLGWVSYIMRDLLDGRLRMGSGSSRGLGGIKGHLDSLSVSYIGEPPLIKTHIAGIGSLATLKELEDYKLNPQDKVPVIDDVEFKRKPGEIRSANTITDSTRQRAFMAAVAKTWDDFVNIKAPIGAA